MEGRFFSVIDEGERSTRAHTNKYCRSCVALRTPDTITLPQSNLSRHNIKSRRHGSIEASEAVTAFAANAFRYRIEANDASAGRRQEVGGVNVRNRVKAAVAFMRRPRWSSSDAVGTLGCFDLSHRRSSTVYGLARILVGAARCACR